MPCNTIQIATVELGNVNKELLDAAMKELGIPSYAWSFQNGVLTIRGSTATSERVAEIKRAYSKQVVLSQARKFGWQVKQTGVFQWQVTKR